METYSSPIPIAVVAVSLVATVLIVASDRRPNVREAWTLLAALAKMGLVISLLPPVLNGQAPHTVLIEVIPDVPIALKADPLGLYFALVSSTLWLATSVYSIGYMRGHHFHKQTRYYASFAVSMSSAMGIAFAANLLTFFLFYELLTIATYPLVIHRETPEAISAGRKYLVYTLGGGLALLLATAWAYGLTGTLTFQPGGFLSTQIAAPQLLALLAFFTLGVSVKAGVMPLHSWLPTAMIAPTPVSALLHAVAVVKAGVFGYLRVIGFVFGPALLQQIGGWQLLAWVAGVTLVLGSLMALRHDHLKRRLAYSTISHLSYIILGTVLLAPISWVGALLHLAAHAAMKITLFFCAGAIDVKTHREYVSQLTGIGRQMPVTMGAFAVVSVGMAGLPPVVGFISKWHLGLGTLQAGWGVFLALLMFSGLLNAAYLFPIVYRAFFVRSAEFTRYDEASWFMVGPLALVAVVSVLIGVLPDMPYHLYQLATSIATSVTGGAG